MKIADLSAAHAAQAKCPMDTADERDRAVAVGLLCSGANPLVRSLPSGTQPHRPSHEAVRRGYLGA